MGSGKSTARASAPVDGQVVPPVLLGTIGCGESTANACVLVDGKVAPVDVVTRVDTQDLKWQVDPTFKPDKTELWKHPEEKDGWMHSHNAIRDEIARFKDALSKLAARGKVRQWEVACVREAWKQHEAHIHAHHSNEENDFVPFLMTRFKVDEKVADEHKTLMETLVKLEGLISDLKPEESEAAGKLHAAWVEYEDMMKPHLEEEELTQLPLMRAYFAPEEINPLVKKVVGKGPPSEMGSFICTLGDEMFFEFMRQEGIPSFVWYLEFKAKRDSFRRAFIDNLSAVAAGSPPRHGGGLLACCRATPGAGTELVVA